MEPAAATKFLKEIEKLPKEAIKEKLDKLQKSATFYGATKIGKISKEFNQASGVLVQIEKEMEENWADDLKLSIKDSSLLKIATRFQSLKSKVDENKNKKLHIND